MLRYDLQFFADGQGGEKTEPATSKKLSDARKEGQVAKSREIPNGFSIFALFLVLKFWVGTMSNQLLDIFTVFYGRIADVVVFWHGYMPENDSKMIFRYLLIRVIVIIAPLLLIAVLIAFICNVAQVKWKPTTKPMQPKFSKMNPISGLKKIISLNSLIELIKAIAKVGLIAYMCYSYLKDKWPLLFMLYDIPLLQALKLLLKTVTDLGIRIAAMYMVIAFADFAYQKYKFAKDMRMTKQEVKDEYKNSEGDPQIKGQIRQRMMQASQRRMMQDLPRADVVITNPTHYAVAIKYEPEVADAPTVLAKGEDYLLLPDTFLITVSIVSLSGAKI